MAIQLRLLDPDPRPVAGSAPKPGPRRAKGARRSPARATRPEAAGSQDAGAIRPWALDDRTCEIGLRGVEEARRALAAAVARSSAA